MGVSLKRFDGWTPKTITVVTEWTPAGFPVRWESREEVEWDLRQRSLMLALAYYEGGLCRRCGQHLSKTMDPMTDPDRPEATANWVADGPDECFCCKALHRAEKKLSEDKESGDLGAYAIHVPMLVPVTPRGRIR